MKKFSLHKNLLLCTLGLVLLSSCSEDETPLLDPNKNSGQDINYTWAATADSLQTATYNSYIGQNGTFNQDNVGTTTFHYWPNAHVLDVLADGYERTGDQAYVPKMKALISGIKLRNGNTYNNDFNDDMIWLASASLRAYKLTNDQEYKDVAMFLWNQIKKSWSDDVFGGGITWRQSTPRLKNAVSNAPAAIVALRLYDIDKNPDDLVWAKKIYEWQKNNLVDAKTGLVWDNIEQNETGVVTTKKEWVFTYNMGTWIGAGVMLYKVTNDRAYLSDALKSAKTLTTSPNLTSGGLLRDEGQGDGGLFKGILVRYYTDLIQEPTINSTDRSMLVRFLRFNAETFYRRGINRPAMLAGPNWGTKPTERTDLTTQLSAVMLIEAAAKLDEEGLLK